MVLTSSEVKAELEEYRKAYREAEGTCQKYLMDRTKFS
jgi:hypothetical protein